MQGKMMDTQLHTLILAAQGGDLDAFGAIVKRFQGMAYATAYSMLDDAGLAEDVAQEAFMEAYQNLPKLRENDSRRC
jgi:DNA-directed RNA polymerase specialized sigma24 family protein